MKKHLRNLLVLLLVLAGAPASADNVAVYVSGHPDDWQLFMNPDAYQDLTAPDHRVVFIYLTSGDQGLRTGGRGLLPLFLARENGAVRSGSFASNQALARPDSLHKGRAVLRNNHWVMQYRYENAVHYFLRMPDVADWQSRTLLDQFRQQPGLLGPIDAVAPAYASWTELTATVRAIITAETRQADHFRLNALDPDMRYNPDDHPDHRNAGALAVAACQGLKTRIKLFQGYATGMYPENLSEEEKLNEAALFALAASATIEAGYDNTWEFWHKAFLGKNYYRLYYDPASLQTGGLPSFDGLPTAQHTAGAFALDYISPLGHSDADQNIVMQSFDRASEFIAYHKRHFNNMHLLVYVLLLLGGFSAGLVVRRRHTGIAAQPPEAQPQPLPVHHYA